MQDIRMAAVSMNGRLGEPAAVLDEISEWTKKAVAEGAELIPRIFNLMFYIPTFQRPSASLFIGARAR